MSRDEPSLFGGEHARRSDPSTSQRAAADVDPNAVITRDSQKHVLLREYAVAGGYGLTADEACLRTGLTRGGWKRVSDLLSGGFVLATDRERETTAGKAGRVLVIATRGWVALRAFEETDVRTYRP